MHDFNDFMEPFIQKMTKRHSWPYILITLLVTLSYVPTFTGEFILDDNPLIKNNQYIKEPHSLASYFDQEDGIVERENGRKKHTGYYRPFINLTYRMDYKLWGMKPQGFRTTNFLLHLLTSFLLFKFIVLVVNDRQIAFWATLLFALHPVNTESVSWVSSRNNILATLFFLLSLYFYIKGWETESHLNLTGSVLFFSLAIFSKEFGLLVLPCIFLYQRLLSRKRRNISDQIISYLPFLLIGIGYFLLRKMVTGSWLTPSEGAHLWKRIYFTPYLIGWNLKLIFFPYGLHSFIVKYPSRYFDWQVFVSFFSIALLGLITWKVWKNRLAAFAICSFHVTLFPILNIVPTSAVTLISMRWLYFPMIFVTLAASQFINKFLKTNSLVTIIILNFTVISFGAYSYILNRYLWRNEDAFLRQEVFHFNNHFYAGGLAEKLLVKKDYSQAERYFQMAIQKHPEEVMNYTNYAALLVETGRPGEAISLLKRVQSLAMTHKERGTWHNNVGTGYFCLNKYKEALKHLKKAVNFWPGESQFWSSLGAAYGAVGDYANSISALRKGQDLHPDSVHIKKNIAAAHYGMGDYAQAISVLKSIPYHQWRETGVKQLLDKARKGLESK